MDMYHVLADYLFHMEFIDTGESSDTAKAAYAKVGILLDFRHYFKMLKRSSQAFTTDLFRTARVLCRISHGIGATSNPCGMLWNCVLL